MKSVVFDIATTETLATSPFSGFAVRAQSTSNPSGSIKTNLVPDISTVPLPASGLLLIGALLGANGRQRCEEQDRESEGRQDGDGGGEGLAAHAHALAAPATPAGSPNAGA